MKKFIGFYDYTVILTYLSIVSAVFGMTLASKGHFFGAILCLLFSGLCDGFDGTVARTKKNRSEDEKNFGIQLDSLCDVVSFGVFPAYLCYCMGVNTVIGIILVCLFSLCAVIRLAFFNVLEAKRQKVEEGGNKTYRGLPVTSISIIFPALYILHWFLSAQVFLILLYVMLFVVAFLFIFDFRVKKLDLGKLFSK
ncbi:MAG: CDP-alcohol phosphatidyltransferase family protein [Oscillospiraceae bacterium]|nr:CDP-alcohol phosphatidyltransferase family protein [Oscillospiraceae bacterium]